MVSSPLGRSAKPSFGAVRANVGLASERERGDKSFHNAFPFVAMVVRGFLQSDGPTAGCSAVNREMAPRNHRINHVLGLRRHSKRWRTHRFRSGGTALRFCPEPVR
jgi:hypothetical protein